MMPHASASQSVHRIVNKGLKNAGRVVCKFSTLLYIPYYGFRFSHSSRILARIKYLYNLSVSVISLHFTGIKQKFH